MTANPLSPNPPSPGAPFIGELLDRACAGEDDAFTDAFDRHLPELRRRIEQRAGGAGRGHIDTDVMIDEVILDVYLAALRRLEDFDSRDGLAFGRWLACIADLCLADADQRRAPRRPLHPDRAGQKAPTRRVPDQDAGDVPAATPDAPDAAEAPRPEVFADLLRRRELVAAATATLTEEEAFAASWDATPPSPPLPTPKH